MQAARGASLTSSDQDTGPTSPRPRRTRLIFAAVALAAFALDLVTKQLALAHLEDRDIPVVGDIFVLHLTHNPGAAFSTGTDFTIVFTVLAMVAVLVVLFVARRLGSVLWAIGLGVLLGGVAGNLTDRIVRDPEPLHGHVVDFLMFPNFPVFNVADICINVAAGLIILQSFRGIAVDGHRHGDHDEGDEPEGAGDAAGGAGRA
jgi:signal peptidase II